MKQSGLPLAVKRLVDVAAAGTVLLVTAPLMALVALAIRAADGRPILFRQRRPGKGARPFTMLKFRTMRGPTGDVVDPELDKERVTRVGRFLRTTSVDELPQLWNVLRGQMSLVGPRPLMMQYLPRYSAEQQRRHDVLPGITGWAQVKGRNALTWEEKFALDVWYVDHWSPWLDMRIIAKTVVSVIRREGISSEGHVTMPEFRGGESARG